MIKKKGQLRLQVMSFLPHKPTVTREKALHLLELNFEEPLRDAVLMGVAFLCGRKDKVIRIRSRGIRGMKEKKMSHLSIGSQTTRCSVDGGVGIDAPLRQVEIVVRPRILNPRCRRMPIATRGLRAQGRGGRGWSLRYGPRRSRLIRRERKSRMVG